MGTCISDLVVANLPTSWIHIVCPRLLLLKWASTDGSSSTFISLAFYLSIWLDKTHPNKNKMGLRCSHLRNHPRTILLISCYFKVWLLQYSNSKITMIHHNKIFCLPLDLSVLKLLEHFSKDGCMHVLEILLWMGFWFERNSLFFLGEQFD